MTYKIELDYIKKNYTEKKLNYINKELYKKTKLRNNYMAKNYLYPYIK